MVQRWLKKMAGLGLDPSPAEKMGADPVGAGWAEVPL